MVTCDEIISVMDIVSTKMTNTIATNTSIDSDGNKLRFIYIYIHTYIYIYIYIYIFYIIQCKIKRDNYEVPRTLRVLKNKTNSKKRKEKFTNSASNYCNKYKI